MTGHATGCACCSDQLIPAFNAAKKKRSANPLRRDPSRTNGLQRRFLAEVARRWRELQRDLRELIVEEDALGLREPTPLSGLPTARQLVTHAQPQRWRFLTSDKKVEAFRGWLDERIQTRLLSAATGENAWTAKYVFSAYKQGLLRAYTDSQRNLAASGAAIDFLRGGRDQFLRSSFFAPEAVSKIKLLATRTFESLRGVTATMSAQMARALADGLANGKGVLAVGKSLADMVDGIPLSRARTIARTEIMHSHSEGQLDSFEELGVDGLNVMAEWSTAGDDRVCPLCQPLEGVVMTVKEARGIIPRHPNCRCTWIPADVGEKTDGQKRTRSRVASAISRSVKRETGKKTDAAARDASRWAGADV